MRALFVVAILLSTLGQAAVPQRFAVTPGHHLSVYATQPLAGNDAEAAVIVVHGVYRDADAYFANMVAAARAAGALGRTLILAPRFVTESDAPAADDLVWTSLWKQGDDSADGVSTFDAMDRLLQHLARRDLFPRLTRIVVTGHSAGGQFVSRYALSGHADERVRYVIANPSTYVYLDDRRDTPPVDCPDYDDYPYGLKAMNRYVAAVGETALRDNVKSRDLTVLLGEKDTEQELLDMSCGAMLQGKNRFERGVTYHRLVERFYHPSRLRLVTVPGVGHDNGAMYQSKPGRDVLFAR